MEWFVFAALFALGVFFAAFSGDSFPVFVVEELSDGFVEVSCACPAVMVGSAEVFSLAFVATEGVFGLFEGVFWSVECSVAVVACGFDSFCVFGGSVVGFDCVLPGVVAFVAAEVAFGAFV